jgi:hypothetical protein
MAGATPPYSASLPASAKPSPERTRQLRRSSFDIAAFMPPVIRVYGLRRIGMPWKCAGFLLTSLATSWGSPILCHSPIRCEAVAQHLLDLV